MNNDIILLDKTHIDAIYLIEIENHELPWSEEQIRQCFDNQDLIWGIHSTDNKLIGFYIARLLADEIHLLNIGVAKSKQRMGVGKQLLLHLVKEALLAKATVIWLEVRKSNQKAIEFYKNFGFQFFGIRPDYYTTPASREDALLLTYPLNLDV